MQAFPIWWDYPIKYSIKDTFKIGTIAIGTKKEEK
jgi:hypothetical protein